MCNGTEFTLPFQHGGDTGPKQDGNPARQTLDALQPGPIISLGGSALATLPSPTYTSLFGWFCSLCAALLHRHLIALASPPPLQPPTQPRIHFHSLAQGCLLRAFTQERPCHTEPGLGLLTPRRKCASFLMLEPSERPVKLPAWDGLGPLNHVSSLTTAAFQEPKNTFCSFTSWKLG